MVGSAFEVGRAVFKTAALDHSATPPDRTTGLCLALGPLLTEPFAAAPPPGAAQASPGRGAVEGEERATRPIIAVSRHHGTSRPFGAVVNRHNRAIRPIDAAVTLRVADRSRWGDSGAGETHQCENRRDHRCAGEQVPLGNCPSHYDGAGVVTSGAYDTRETCWRACGGCAQPPDEPHRARRKRGEAHQPERACSSPLACGAGRGELDDPSMKAMDDPILPAPKLG